MSRSIRQNPKWSDEIVKKNCDQIKLTCKEFNLPIPILDSKCQIDAELGYGTYGTVYHTEDPSIVMKTTSDESESHFIAMSLALGEAPKGIVKYFGIFGLENKYQGARTFILWREAAKSIGLRATDSASCEIKEFEEQLMEYYRHADEAFFMASEAARNMPVEEYWAWLKTDVDAANAILDGKKRDIPILVPKFARYLAKAYAVAESMEDNTKSFWVGQCLRSYLKSGLLLGDIHLSNVGQVERGNCGGRLFVVSDPGHCLVLRRKLSQIEIPMIGGGR